MQAEHDPATGVRAEHDQCHACREQARRRGNDERREHPHQGTRRTLRLVGPRASVVAGEAPAGALKLQHHRRDQQHADEDVDRQKRPQEEDRDALDREQHEQHGRRHRRETRVPLGPAETPKAGATPGRVGAKTGTLELGHPRSGPRRDEAPMRSTHPRLIVRRRQ